MNRQSTFAPVSASAFVAAFAIAAASRAAGTWNLTADFSNQNGNPNGAWSYGWMPTGFGVLTLYSSPLPGTTYPSWMADNSSNMWKNIGEGAPFGVPPGEVSLHPGASGEPCVVRWTAPAGLQGGAHAFGQFLPGDLGSMAVAVRHNGSEIWAAMDSGAFDLQVDAVAGDTLDFAVYGGYSSGNTPLQLTIEATVGCVGDLNADGTVNGADLGLLIAGWGGASAVADLNDDGVVNGADLGLLIANWGSCG